MQDAQFKEQQKIVKMLLLGAGESGKSTIFKQMKVINKNGYSDAELKEFLPVVHGNVVQSLSAMIGAFDKLGMPVPADVAPDIDKFKADTADEKLTPAIGALVKKLWKSESFQALFTRRAEFQLNDSAEFYFENVDRLAAEGYLPTVDDVLRSRVRTTGIVQSDFKIKGLDFSMFDVGGQRNERRKWIHCFDNVDAVVFVASLSEFDQVLFEDETKNRLEEAYELFGQIVNSKWFFDSSLILFLNKKDLFEKKLKDKVFSEYVNKNIPGGREEYSGPNELAPTSEYVKTVMLAKNKNKDKSIFTHVTTAIDTSNVKFVFNAVVAMILEKNLKSSGLA
jgi:GTPase SAR1 family protein